jgi:isopenicillin-N epimerase
MPYTAIRRGKEFAIIQQELKRIESVLKSSQLGGRRITQLFLLRDDITFLNNGSFGAPPKVVMMAQNYWRERMESQPVLFFTRDLPVFMRGAATMLANFLNAQPENMAFVDNATSGVNTVIRSLMPKLKAGDEIVTTTHVYGAVRNTLHYAAHCTGAIVREVEIPFPLESPYQIIRALNTVLSSKTVLMVMDHLTSPTGLIFPAEEILRICRNKNIPVLIDGAHVPGMLPLNLKELQPDWYTGNCHKWLFAPKGCAFLWTHPDRAKDIHPLAVSHGYGLGYAQEFDWTGTKDYSPYLSVGTAIEFFQAGDPETLNRYQHKLAIEARSIMCEAWKTQAPAPDYMIGALASAAIPRHLMLDNIPIDKIAMALHDILWDEYQIEVPVIAFAENVWIRIAAHIYNNSEQYEFLAETVARIEAGKLMAKVKKT